MRPLLPLALALLAPLGCTNTLGEPDDGLGRTPTDSTDLALVSSTGESQLLRFGESLSLASTFGLAPNTVYRAEVLVDGDIVSSTEILTDLYGGVLLATVMHDVGEEGLVRAGEPLALRMTDPYGEVVLDTTMAVATPPRLQVPGFNVEEIQPPHIFAADATGAPQNAFAVGGSGGAEVRGPVHVAGDGFPEAVAGGVVDVYVVRDADEWRDRAIPVAGDPAYVSGPTAVPVQLDGSLVPTAVFAPDLPNVGIFDILVDVDRDGRFEWTFNAKDGADGLARVGFTVQYSQSWLIERTSRHILVNMAFDQHQRDGGVWRNDFARTEPVFLYLNPPVMHQYHFSVRKVIVRHQDFASMWNNPAAIDPTCGGVPYDTWQVRSLELTTENGCTNTSPTCFGVLPPLGDGEPEEGEMATFDVVFDRDADGCYDVGDDLLDIVSSDTDGLLVDVDRFLSMLPADQVGFRMR